MVLLNLGYLGFYLYIDYVDSVIVDFVDYFDSLYLGDNCNYYLIEIDLNQKVVHFLHPI
jgi:hypothetical protein